MDLNSIHVFSVWKADNGTVFTAGGLSIAGQIIIHSVETRINRGYFLDYEIT
jgi:hypothetical protein